MVAAGTTIKIIENGHEIFLQKYWNLLKFVKKNIVFWPPINHSFSLTHSLTLFLSTWPSWTTDKTKTQTKIRQSENSDARDVPKNTSRSQKNQNVHSNIVARLPRSSSDKLENKNESSDSCPEASRAPLRNCSTTRLQKTLNTKFRRVRTQTFSWETATKSVLWKKAKQYSRSGKSGYAEDPRLQVRRKHPSYCVKFEILRQKSKKMKAHY